MQKLDPYLNVDPGTMNPFQHGEVLLPTTVLRPISTLGTTSASLITTSVPMQMSRLARSIRQ